jgi:hypothetical protein
MNLLMFTKVLSYPLFAFILTFAFFASASFLSSRSLCALTKSLISAFVRRGMLKKS